VRAPAAGQDRPDWLRLDNAAKIYPATFADPAPAGFRLAVTLKAPIRVALLQEALRGVLRRFPYSQVHLRRGFFWYYLQRHDGVPLLRPMGETPVAAIPAMKRDTDLYRVQARGSTIAVDFSHILTDGAGGMAFLGTLAGRYLELGGVRVSAWAPFPDPSAEPSAEEYEDAHNRFFDSRAPRPALLSRAWQLPGERQPRYRIITGCMPVGDVLARARGLGVTLTEYLAALYMFSLAEVRAALAAAGGRAAASVIRLEVPVDMRQFFPTKTLRNFSLYASPEIDLVMGGYAMEEIVRRVHHSMGMQVEPRELGRQIGRNVRAERNPVIRAMPLLVKDAALSLAYRRIGERTYSGVLSNLGRVAVPASLEPHVESFDFLLNPSYGMKTNCAVLGFRDTLRISFGSIVADRELERRFFTRLAADGIRLVVSER
jgi:hypothetical protein